MRPPSTFRARRAAFALLALAVALSSALAASSASAQAPTAGGQVPSTIALSLGEPGPFKRTGRGLFTAVLRAEASATEVPTRLSLLGGGESRRLRFWREPTVGARARVRLRQRAPNRRALRNRRGRLWVTLSAGGP
jgi:hypothetical protein